MQSSCSTRKKWNSDTWREKKNKTPTSEDPLWATLVTVRTKNYLLTGRDLSQRQAQKGAAIHNCPLGEWGEIEAKKGIVKMNWTTDNILGWILIRLVLLLLLEGLNSLFISVIVSKCHKKPTAQVTHCSVGKQSGPLVDFLCLAVISSNVLLLRRQYSLLFVDLHNWIQNDIRWCYMNPRYYKAGIKVKFSEWITLNFIWFLLSLI